jgi:type IV secretory pathway TrbF-like protein
VRLFRDCAVNAAPPSNTAEASDPYEAAQTHALDEVARERAASRTWRRVACGALAVAALIGADNFSLQQKLRGPAESLVYADTGHGYEARGVASDANVPSDIALQAGVQSWLENCRSVPGIDYDLAEQQKNACLAMTDRNAQIAATLNANYASDDPRKLGKYEVRAINVDEVTPLATSAGASTRSYIVRWKEQTTTSAGVTSTSYSGQVTVAANAPIPGEIQAARLNPNGVYVEQVVTDSPLR